MVFPWRLDGVAIRRTFRPIIAISVVGLFLAACQTVASYSPALTENLVFTKAMYASIPDGDFELPAIRTSTINKKYWRQIVRYKTDEAPGTLIVDTPNRFLYLVLPDGSAIRYGIGVGAAGFSWSGNAVVAWKRKWPTWTPPAEMIERRPHLAKYKDGMDPGLSNPLGARALYIFEGGKDTLYRLHGTNEPWSIGKAASSGCIRLLNQDVVDLYRRVKDGAKIVVIPDPKTHMPEA